MKIRVCQNSINSTLASVISLSDWDKGELDAIVRYGDPVVDVGGWFLKQGCKEVSAPPPPTSTSLDDRVRSFLDRLRATDVTGIASGNAIVDWIKELKDASMDVGSYRPEDVDAHPECFFDIPSSEKRIYADFPVMMEFDRSKYDQPELCAKSWSDEIVRRLTVAVRGLRCFSTLVIKEEVYEV